MGRMPWTCPPSRTEQVNNHYKYAEIKQVAWQGEIEEKIMRATSKQPPFQRRTNTKTKYLCQISIEYKVIYISKIQFIQHFMFSMIWVLIFRTCIRKRNGYRYTHERWFFTAQKALKRDAYADRSKQWIWNTVSPASGNTHASFINSVLQVLPLECEPALWQEMQQSM